jgi:hypothetical protein
VIFKPAFASFTRRIHVLIRPAVKTASELEFGPANKAMN